MNTQLAIIDISKENIKFSGAHFTIFSATERERLHGHNFRVRAEITATVDDNGLCFNYQDIKQKLRVLCDSLDEYVLIPEHSPHLNISHNDDKLEIEFNGETMSFPSGDTLLLPIRNTTVEEFSRYIANTLATTENFLSSNGIQSLKIGVSSGDGQWGSVIVKP